uniref:LRRCT domain-containing protein n=1 Tax=Syphacia muris TaxID=451379 RepID=A0A0N5ASA3_9BILA
MKQCSINIIVITIVIFFQATRTAATNDNHNSLNIPIRCNFLNLYNTNWNQCKCSTVGNDTEAIICTRTLWTTIPKFYPEKNSSEDQKLKISSLQIVRGNLVELQENAFKNLQPESITLAYNHISDIHANAFQYVQDRLQKLNLNNNQITSFPILALSNLQQLFYLSLQNNLISAVDTANFKEAKLRKLRYLHLDNNQIEYLPNGSLSNLPLHVLTISNNRITTVSPSALPKTLWFLDLKNNDIQEIPYHALNEIASLKTLDLEGNNITEINVRMNNEFKNPVNLLLKNNKIRSLNNNAFQSFHKLQKLDVSYNQIERIHAGVFNSITELKYLDLSNNKIVSIPTKTFHNIGKSLQVLNLEDNFLHILPAAIENLRALEVINLNNNKLITINDKAWKNLMPALIELLLAYNRLSLVPTETLEQMKKLQKLDLSKNRIRRISSLSFGNSNGASATLQKINLAGNLINEITDSNSFAHMSALLELDLSHNQINVLGDAIFTHLTNLNYLNLEGNKLSEFPKTALNGLTRLQFLILDENPIEHLPAFALTNVPSLKHLSVGKTLLKDIGNDAFIFNATSNLRTLNMAFCHLTSLKKKTFYNLKKLEALFLHNNQLQELQTTTFSAMENLRHLSLANNNITTIEEKALDNLPALEELSLANNRIQFMPRGSFHHLNNLKYLDLSGNQLRYLDLNFLQQTPTLIERLDLSNNIIEILDLTDAKRTLTHLNLANNKFQSIDRGIIHDFGKLQFLDLSDNSILKIQPNAFIKSKKLHIVKLGRNHLSALTKGTFVSQERLDILKLESNEIHRIDEGTFGLNNVYNIDLSHNNIEEIPRQALRSIKNSISSLNFNNNKLQIVDVYSFMGMENLTKLFLANNRIETVEEAAFATLNGLLELDLSNNPVLSWNPQAFKGISPSMELMNLAHTGLYSLPKITNHDLRHLNISGNDISELQEKDMATFKKLETLDVSGNKLTTFNENVLKALTQLKALNICSNPIKKINSTFFKYLGQVEELVICRMPTLNYLPHPNEFRRLTSLKHLKLFETPVLSNYKIAEILQNLPPLQTLDIEVKEERLDKQFEMTDMRLLRSLTIRGRALKQLEPNAFIRLRGLKFNLAIHNTSIEYIPTIILNALMNVNQLSLSIINNKIQNFNPFKHTQIPFINQHGTVLESLHVKEIKLLCQCDLQWVISWCEYVATKTSGNGNVHDIKCSLQNRYKSKDTISYIDFINSYCNRAAMQKFNFPGILLLTILAIAFRSFYECGK